MRLAFGSAAVACALLSGSCQSSPRTDQGPSSTAGVTHVVICWQKHPGDPAERHALLDAGARIRSIPGVLQVSTGTMLPSTRPIVDTTWDVAYVITFADQQAMNAYLSNPDHMKLKHDVLDPNVRQVKVYDLVRP